MTWKFAISGASGWLGREFIYSLLKNGHVNSLDELKLYSSEDKILDFGEFGEVKSTSFLDVDPMEIEGVENFIHLAFLTRDLEPRFGLEKYFQINSRLTHKASEIIRIAQPKSVVNVSSGAVFNRITGELEHDWRSNPYGFGKLQEEAALISACESSTSRLSIGRLWGCSGEFMPVNRAYALSDLIYTSITERRIVIKAKGKVWRRYCDAGQFMNLLHVLSQHEQFKLINSGGPIVEIGELADLVCNFLGGVQIQRDSSPLGSDDDYYPRDPDYEALAKKYDLHLSDITEQVQRTIIGHKRALLR